jgi:O-antigen/teichoic acid export membrane protein
VPVLFSYAGWITVTNMITPFLTTADRMLIGSMLNSEAVAYYSVAFTLVTRAQFIPGALASSLFPRFAHGSEADNRRAAQNAMINVASIMALFVVIGNFALPSLMRIWVGDSFAARATPVGLILFVSVWMNGLNFIPYSLLQATNRPRLNAMSHLAEIIPFVALLLCGVHYFGLVGAAWACVLRSLVDGFLLFYWTGYLGTWKQIWPGAVLVILSTVIAPYKFTLLSVSACIVVSAVCAGWSWTMSQYFRRIFLHGLTVLNLKFKNMAPFSL